MLGIMSFAQEEIPQSQFLGFDLELLNNRNDGLPSAFLVCRELCMGHLYCRKDFIL